jgi:hypothetical protein
MKEKDQSSARVSGRVPAVQEGKLVTVRRIKGLMIALTGATAALARLTG